MQLFEKENSLIRGAFLTKNNLYYAANKCFDDEKYKPKMSKRICETAFKGTVMQII